nr:hypothetical protein CFP56_49566 [Quercus suber]
MILHPLEYPPICQDDPPFVDIQAKDEVQWVFENSGLLNRRDVKAFESGTYPEGSLVCGTIRSDFYLDGSKCIDDFFYGLKYPYQAMSLIMFMGASN